MSIASKPPKPTPDTFIEGAPDAKRTPLMKGNREQISHTIPPELLARLDAYAPKIGQTRAGAINLAISMMLERGVNLDGGTHAG